MGKAPKQTPLPKSTSVHSITIRPTPLPPPPIELPPEVKQHADKVRASEAALVVQERLLRPHTVIASWLTQHEQKKRRARSERDPWRRNLYDPGDFSETEGFGADRLARFRDQNVAVAECSSTAMARI